MAEVNKISGKRLVGPLASIPSPPSSLECVGESELLSTHGVAVVGSRRSSQVELDVAYRIGEALGRSGITVVSGLALGVDAAAHAGALAGGGTTVAIIGSGLAKIGPWQNVPLAREIIASGKGAIASEYERNEQARPRNFVARNRLITGLSKGVVVVSASLKSGTMHAVRFACEQGKSIHCPVMGSMSEGTEALLTKDARTLAEQSSMLVPILKVESLTNPLGTPFRSTDDGIAAVASYLKRE